MDDTNPLAYLAAGVGAGLISSKIGQRNTERNMQRSYELGQQAQRNSIPNFIHSAKAAGISPAIAAAGAGSAFSNPVGPNAPQGHDPQMPNFLEMSQIMQNEKLVDAQVRQADAEVRKVNAQIDQIEGTTESTNRENIHRASKDATINLLLREKWRAEGREDLANAELDYDLGTLEGLDSFDNYVTQMSDRQLRLVDNELMSKVKKHQLSDEYGIWRDIAEMPSYDRRSLYSELALNAARVKNLAELDLTEQKNRQKADSEMKKILADIDRAYNTDFVGNIKDGHYLDAGLILFGQGATEFSKGLGQGLGESFTPFGKSKIRLNDASSRHQDRMPR